MSQTKFKLSDDLKMTCISIVKGYERRVKLYHKRRDSIIHGNAPAIVKVGGNSSKPDPTADKVFRLERVDEMFDTRAMFAVEQAANQIGRELHSEQERQRMIDSVFESCINGRNFCFSHTGLPMHKDTFYERRREFLWRIADNLGLLE